MCFASAVTREWDIDLAAHVLVSTVRARLSATPVDFLYLFYSHHRREEIERLALLLRAELAPRVMLGCSAEAVIGPAQEIEREPAISLVAARMPGVRLHSFALGATDWARIREQPDALRDLAMLPLETRLVVMCADPCSTPMDLVLDRFQQDYPDLPIVGGMASGGGWDGETTLLLDGRCRVEGAVGVALAGEVEVDVIVSQGCRPIGEVLTVTAARDNLILALDDRPPVLQLQELHQRLTAEERALLRHGLFVGRAVEAERERPGRGDFLIRAVMGMEPDGAIAIGDHVRPGEKIQFQLRDAATAIEDLEMMLLPQTLGDPPLGGLLFSCNDRGTRLYPHPNGDIDTIQGALGGIELAGCFCSGELGPIGPRNFVHAHTASLALFRPALARVGSEPG